MGYPVDSDRWLQVRLPGDTHRRLRVATAAADLTLTAVIRQLVDRYADAAIADLATQDTRSG
jgi:hypothetical protein